VDYLESSRTAVSVISHLHRGNVDGATQCMALVTEESLPTFISALQALSCQFLKVIDQLAQYAELPDADGNHLLESLREQMSLADAIEIDT